MKMNIKFICTTLLIFISGVYAMTVEDRLLELELTVKLQGRALENHEDVSQDQALIIERLKNENDQLKKRLEVLENNLAEKAESMTNFDKSIQIMPESLTNNSSGSRQKDKLPKTLSGDNDRREKDDVFGKVRVSRTNHNHMMKRQTSGIAFHAYMTGQRCFHDHEVFVFDTEGVDEGNGYDKRDGIYDVPVTGFYVFTWTSTSVSDDWYRADIIICGKSAGWVTTARKNAASGTVIVPVNAGDHVKIQVQGIACNITDNFTRSTFSDWKLF